jgi:uncharacterized protein (DUF433 family)
VTACPRLSAKRSVRGTRVPVARILGSLAGGMTNEQIIEEYRVTADDIAAALEFLFRGP